MFISPSSLTLNPTVFPSGTIPGNVHSDKAYPFPDSLPLSTLLAPVSDHSPTPSSSHTSFSPSPLLLPFSKVSTMPPSGTIGYPYHLNWLDISNPSIQSSSSDASTLDFSAFTTDISTIAGTSLLSSAFSSNSGVSAPLPFWSTASLTMSTSSSTISLSLSSSYSPFTDPSSTPELTSTSTPTSTSPIPTASVSSYSASYSTSSPFPSSLVFTLFTPSSTSVTATDAFATLETTTVIVSTAMVTSLDPPSSLAPSLPPTSTYTITSVLLGQGGTTTDFVTSSIALSTESPGSTVNSTVPLSPGTIVAIVLGFVGAGAFSALWFFCARRRHRKLAQEAALIPSESHASGPLDDEILDVDELGYNFGDTQGIENSTSRVGPVMEERYAGILAALHLTERFGRTNEGGSTGGIYGSHRDSATDMDDDVARASSPTLPLHAIFPDDAPYTVPLSPPPPVSSLSHHRTAQPAPPPSAYHMSLRRRSSPGPDAAAWLGGYSVAPSCNSHYARSQTLGSGSGSGSVDALTRTRTGSEDPLLDTGKVTPEVFSGVSTPGGVSLVVPTDRESDKVGLGSAFGSPAGSMYSPSGVYSTLQHDSSGSYGARTGSGSGSYGYARSGTPSSFDVLRSVSSQGALSSSYSHGHSQGFRFGFGRPGSSSSASTGTKAVSNRHSFGGPPTSFRGWKDWGSVGFDKEKQGEKQSVKEKDWKRRSSSSTSASGSVDEKQGRASPVMGVRALLGRLRRAGHTPSPHSSNKDLTSATLGSTDVDPEKAAADRATPPPIQIQVATPLRRGFSFVLSNPDPRPSSPYSGAGDVVPSDVSSRKELRPIQHQAPKSDPHTPKPAFFSTGRLQQATTLPAGHVLAPAPSPVPTEESPLVEGLLHPRLQIQGRSDASLRDFEDYSRPIGGVVKNRLYSTTTFGTQDDIETRSPSGGTLVQEIVPDDEHECENEAVDVFGTPIHKAIPPDGWIVDELSPPAAARPSSVGG